MGSAPTNDERARAPAVVLRDGEVVRATVLSVTGRTCLLGLFGLRLEAETDLALQPGSDIRLAVSWDGCRWRLRPVDEQDGASPGRLSITARPSDPTIDLQA